MDFRSLSRRELQALCKRNKIAANLTNVAMADALAAHPSVEGIEDLCNGVFSGVPESPMKEEVISAEIPRTTTRTSTRRKVVKDENRDLNVALTTPSLPIGRRRAAAASSACKKVDFQMTVNVVEKEDEDLGQEMNVIEKTPAVPKSQKRVAGASTRKQTETRNDGATEQRVYSTRRSVRLLEKTLERMSLGGDGGKMEPTPVPMSFDEIPNSSGPVKEDIDLESESKKPAESESKLNEGLNLEIDDQEKNEIESEIKHSEVVPEMDLGSLNSSAEDLVSAKSCGDSYTEDNNLDVKSSSEDEETNEASEDEDAVEISAEKISDSVEESGMAVESKQIESICEDSMEEESVVGAIESEHTMEKEEKESVDDDFEEDKKEMEMVSVQAEELVDVKIQLQMEEEAPKDVVSADYLQPKIPNEIQCEKVEALVEASVTKTEGNVQSAPSLASQFPRPTVAATKSQLKEQAIRMIMETSDTEEEEEEEEKEEEKANEVQRQVVEINDLSLRQLKKKFREQLQLGKKKMDNNNNNTTKVVGGGEGKVRTALQTLSDNTMTMNELEKKY